MRKSFIAFLLSLVFMALQGKAQKGDLKKYKDEVKSWDVSRISSLKAANGWVNLAGLFWLKPGANAFGADTTNELVFKHEQFPKQLGTFMLQDGEVVWQTNPGNDVYDRDVKVDRVILVHKDSMRSKQLAYKTFRWTIIRRGELVGVRFRDLAHPKLATFQHIERYGVDPTWKVNAVLEPSMIPSVAITNVLGQTSQQKSPGKIVFNWQGKTYKLDAVDEGEDNLFILFGDETNDVETYPTGRFMYIPKPDASGNTVLDFNKAFNPPCAFSTFATCPIPPRQNVLPFKVTAGEKKVHLD